MPERYIVAIEIGSSKIRGAVGLADDSGMIDVLATEEEKLTDSVRYGCIQNVEVSNAISRICQRLEAYPRFEGRKIKGIYTGIGGRSLSSRIVEVASSLPAEMEITRELIGDLRAKAENEAPADRDVVEVCPVRFTVDNKTQTNPVGSYGREIGARMAVVTCIPQIKRMLRRVLTERLGLTINGYVCRPTAEASMVLTDDERRLGCMLVDFGAETTAVAIYKNGAPLYVATLPLGSRNITLDLTALNYIEERAEEIKKVSGNALPQDASRRPGADGIDYSEVNNYVHARAAEIVANILAQMEYAGLRSADLPGGIIIVGGGARLRGFNELLSQQSKMKVRLGAPQAAVRISDGSIHPAENVDVISILAAAARMPETECMEEPVQREENDPLRKPSASGSYEDMYGEDEDDEDNSRIGRDDEDEEEETPRHRRDKKRKDDEDTPREPSIFEKMKERISRIMRDDADEFE